ncbi:MAG: pantoate--beta-alanine ligase [Lysobacterales bacterium]
MQTAVTLVQMRALAAQWRSEGDDIALVPTMGNLHRGHLALIAAARTNCRRVVATVFVNPTQFGPNEDFVRYPRTATEDAQQLADAGCDAMFLPNVDEVYPLGVANAARVEMPGVSGILCGSVRPGHFAGVASVVLRLFNMIEPDVACFGEKDFQQLLIIRRLARDLSLRVRVVGFPTVRADDGLALSSRNQYLDAAQRAAAPAIWRTLQRMREARRAGEAVAEVEAQAHFTLIASGFLPDYATIRDASDLSPVSEAARGPEVALIAARLGNTRLIDNLPF